MLPASLYISFFEDYFRTNFVTIGLTAGISFLILCFGFFKFTKSVHVKSHLLISMIVTSTSLWIFVLASLAFCMMLGQQYWFTPFSAIVLVSKLALATSAILGMTSMFFFRRRAISGIYQSIKHQSIPIEYSSEGSGNYKINQRLSRILQDLKSRTGQARLSALTIQPVLLRKQSRLPASLAFDSGSSRLIGIKEDVANMLDDDELEAVIAHEVGHIMHRDAFQKSIATAYRVAFPFDVLTKLIEAALYRERELDADEFSAKVTGKPISLASALLKIYESGIITPLENISHISYLINDVAEKGAKRTSLFSREPALSIRIQRLIALGQA
jgi:Zn-dependent protease with chaperone function